ncbi:GTP-binding Era, putative [Babesia ovata]|uniref:GTP-binding Era, putative n=1 Tax=Babesia ovata TaxID=189622 RepID=A0A2H6KAY5_9APIC|nr:GTP-binding Era, putative [Babesia ovata]GBE60145.1 GTP-binding Era, putative [Babesia ovata]
MEYVGPLVRYDSITDVDPFTSAVAAHGDVIVTGTQYGDLILIYGNRRELICSYHGAIVDVQLRWCSSELLRDFVYVVCATSLGYIYVHLVCVTNIAASRVIYKIRTGQEVTALALHPSFLLRHRVPRGHADDHPTLHMARPRRDSYGIHTPQRLRRETTQSLQDESHVGRNYSLPSDAGRVDVAEALTTTANKRRDTYDLRHLLMRRQEKRHNHMGKLEYTESAIMFSLRSGGTYLLRLDELGSEGPERACTLIHRSRRTRRGIPMAWHRDMLALADEDGAHVILLSECASVAFLPHSPRLEIAADRPITDETRGELEEIEEVDDHYVTSDESDVDGHEVEPVDNAEQSEISQTETDDAGSKRLVRREGWNRVRHSSHVSRSVEKDVGKSDKTHSSGTQSLPCAKSEPMSHTTPEQPYELPSAHIDEENGIQTPRARNDAAGIIKSMRRREYWATQSELNVCSGDDSDSYPGISHKGILSDSSRRYSYNAECNVGYTVHSRRAIRSRRSSPSHDTSETDTPHIVAQSSDDTTVGIDDARSTGRTNSKLGTAIKTHHINIRNTALNVKGREPLGVVMCWLSPRVLLVGSKNTMQVVDIIPSLMGKGGFGHKSVTTKRIDFLDVSNSAIRIDGYGVAQYVSVKEKRMQRNVPLRGTVSYTLKAPDTCRIAAIMRHSGKGSFSVIYELDERSIATGVSKIKQGQDSFTFRIVRAQDGSRRNAPKELHGIGSENKAIFAFNAFDPCYNDVYVNESYMQCLRVGDGRRGLNQRTFLQLTCRITEQRLEICRAQQFVMNNFCCYDTDNVEHCLHLVDHPNRKYADTSIRALVCGGSCPADNAAINSLNINSEMLHCFSDPEKFETLCIVVRGLLVTIKGATLMQHIGQLCRHRAHEEALSEIMQMSSVSTLGAECDVYVHDVARKGFECFLSAKSVDVQKIVNLTLPYIRYCAQMSDDPKRAQHIRELVAQFGNHKRMNILLGHILPPAMSSAKRECQDVCNLIRREVFSVVTADMPFVLLRLALTVNLTIEHLREMVKLLKQCITTLASEPPSIIADTPYDRAKEECHPSHVIRECKATGNRGVTWSVGKWRRSNAKCNADPNVTNSKMDLFVCDASLFLGDGEKRMMANTHPKDENDVFHTVALNGSNYVDCTNNLSLAYALLDHDCTEKREPHHSRVHWEGILKETNRIDVELLKLRGGNVPLVNEHSTDFELLSLASFGSNYSLEHFMLMDYGPLGRAAIIALGVLLARTGQLRQAFKFLVYAQCTSSINLANVICDLYPDAGEYVMNAALQLCRIDPQSAIQLLVENSKTPEYITNVVRTLSLEPKFLFGYLSGLSANGGLPSQYIQLFFRLSCVFEPSGIVTLVKSIVPLLKRNEIGIGALLRILLEVRIARAVTPVSDAGSSHEPMMQKELYFAEAYLRYIAGEPWNTVYDCVMMALRFDMMGMRDRDPKEPSVGAIYRRLLALVQPLWDGGTSWVVMQRMMREVCERTAGRSVASDLAAEMYLQFVKYKSYLLCVLEGSQNISMAQYSTQLLDVAKRGMVFNPDNEFVAYAAVREDHGTTHKTTKDAILKTKFVGAKKSESHNVLNGVNVGYAGETRRRCRLEGVPARESMGSYNGKNLSCGFGSYNQLIGREKVIGCRHLCTIWRSSLGRTGRVRILHTAPGPQVATVALWQRVEIAKA